MNRMAPNAAEKLDALLVTSFRFALPALSGFESFLLPGLHRIIVFRGLQGYQVILAAPWYLSSGDRADPDWSFFYVQNPVAGLSTQQASLVLGGEVALWGELLDGTNVVSTAFGRAAAVAERLWSSRAGTSDSAVAAALARLEEHRCRLVARGVPAAPVVEFGYCVTEYGN
eukprot:jgi/Botrbrau1/6739/Bobra.0324s0025.1